MRAEHWVDPAETAPDGDRYSMFGYYDNDLVLTAEGWKLVSVQLKLTRTEGHPGDGRRMAQGQATDDRRREALSETGTQGDEEMRVAITGMGGRLGVGLRSGPATTSW